MGHINYDKFRIGDVVGTTDMSPMGVATRWTTWGKGTAADMSKSTHTLLIVDRGSSLYYASEMGPWGLRMGELHRYDNGPKSWLNHICWVGRHPAFDDWTQREACNMYCRDQHAFGVKYGYRELLQFLFPNLPNEYPNRMVCSQWINVVFKKLNIITPFGEQVAPAHWQKWNALQDVTASIVCQK